MHVSNALALTSVAICSSILFAGASNSSQDRSVPAKSSRAPLIMAQISDPVGPCGGRCRRGDGYQWDCKSSEAPVFRSGGVCVCQVQARCR